MLTRLLVAAALIVLTGLSGTAQAAGHVYLLKGFAGIFSTGLDTLADKLTKRGYNATVHSYDDYASLGMEAAKEERAGGGPVVIIGHSLGANTAFLMTEAMKGAPVALVVLFGPTEDLTATANVARVLNFYQGGEKIDRGRGFHGSITNVNLASASDVNHFNIEKIPRLHSRVIAEIASIMGHGGHGKKPAGANAAQ